MKTRNTFLLLLLLWLIYYSSLKPVLADASLTGQASATAPASAAPLVKIGDYTFVQDGEPYQQTHMPVYEWIPKDVKPDGMVLAIHGLTLHGKRYEVLAKACACTGTYFVAPDLRGFGLCRADTTNKYERRK